jgi:hypothetical protein
VTVSTILIVLLILLLLGALPLGASYNAGWGYGPGGIVFAILLVVVVLALLGRL